MKVYTLHRTQILPVTIAEAWDFFSDPDNLLKITPAEMGLIPLDSNKSVAMYQGQIIKYSVRLFPGISTTWVTEITHVNAPYYFVDEQRVGPYALWQHQHHFRAIPEGVEMTDQVTYAIGWSLLGRLAHGFFVQQKLNAVFDYRFQMLNAYFVKR